MPREPFGLPLVAWIGGAIYLFMLLLILSAGHGGVHTTTELLGGGAIGFRRSGVRSALGSQPEPPADQSGGAQ